MEILMITRCAVKILHSFTALFSKSGQATSMRPEPRIHTDAADQRGLSTTIRRIRENPWFLLLQSCVARFSVTDLVAHARRVRNAPYIANAIPAWRLICFIACFSLILSTQPVVPVGMGKSAEKNNTHLTRGLPGPNLPNLNEARRMNPGVPKIAPLVSAPFASKIGPSATATVPVQEDNWTMALLAPENRGGTSGEDLLSRNFNWGAPIVGLPGRAGMDLNLGLSLNSLIWTKSGTNIHFDLDKGFPSPGFRLGFPELGAAFYNTETGTGSTLVTMPSGQRYEFRENVALRTNGQYVYEEMGGTYMVLVVKLGVFDYRDTVWTLLLTDGTAYKFKIPTNNNNPKCVEVKDRNGNYISITYTSFEQISAVTDTLGRVVNFSYDGSNRLTSITQNWGGGTHTYATFAYDNVTIRTNFPGLDMVEVANGTTVSVLSRVGMADGKVYAFEYNTYAQVKTIKYYAPNSANPGNFPGDYTLLSSISYDLPTDAGGPQSDCPRFFSRLDWAKDWNGGALTSYAGDGATWGSATAPDGTVYKEFFGASGWQRGLTLQTETWSNGSRKKWTASTWVNDNPNVSYWLNPRVVEINVYDDNGSQRRTTVAYADFGAVSDVREYDAPPNTSTVLRRTHFEYLRGTAYTGNLKRRLTQLVTSQSVYDGNDALFSKVTYEYDLGDQYLVHQTPLIRHDTTNFGPTFVQGRGDLNVVRRWDVTDPNNIGKSFAITAGYNTSGSVIFSRDPLNHQASVSYADSFSDSVSHNTLAYPTTITDPDNYSSTVQYNYDFGAVTRGQDRRGAAAVNTYDSIGRVERVTNQVNGAYIRYVYAPNHLYMESFATVNDLSSEFHQITVFDGYGRKRGAASEHPGSAGGYKAQSYEYDIMGRLIRQSNPTEISANWVPTGDDQVWVLSSQAYDWQGRPTASINQDGAARSISYEGCGCAGVQTVTVTDEVGRRQREFYDILGRVSRTQTLNWDGTIYSTTVNTYNARDQVTRVREFKGAGPAPGDESCPMGLCQETLMGYDGHGRLNFRKRPEEGASGTTYTYYNDDMMQTSTDARGASALFTYNARHLTTNITYATPNPSDIPASPNVSFQYDEMGNRTQMNDGAGTVTYAYDGLSRITSETRYFSHLASQSYRHQRLEGPGPLFQTTYQIGYSYNLVGQLSQITTLTGDTIDYTRDRAGAVTKVSGTPRDGVTDYVSDISYRAWGAEKSLSVGFLNYSVSKSYNGRLQISQIDDQGKLSANFTYTPDGLINTVQGLHDRRLDRSFTYDHVRRVTGTRSASAAGLGSSEPPQFQQDYGYDEFDHMTLRSGKYWYTLQNTFSAAYTNNIASNVADNGSARNWQYDAAGNVKSESWTEHQFDAVGREVKTTNSETATYHYDGDGRLVTHINTDYVLGLDKPRGTSTYYLWSSVLKENLASIEINGLQIPGEIISSYTRRTFIHVNGQQVAYRQYDRPDGYDQPNLGSYVGWTFRDPLNTMSRSLDGGTQSGTPRDTLYSIDPLSVLAQAASQSEIDEYWTPPPSKPAPDPNNPPEGFYLDLVASNTTFGGLSRPHPGNWGLGCYVDNVQVSCEKALRTVSNGGPLTATLSLNGAVGPEAAPIVAGFRSAATSIDGQDTRRTHLVPVVVPGKKEAVIKAKDPITGKLEVIDTLRGPDRTVNLRVYDGPAGVLAISGYLVFGGDGRQVEIDTIDPGGFLEGFKSQDALDSAGRTCQVGEIEFVKLAGRNTLIGDDGMSTRNIIPHTWLILPDGKASGFAPKRNRPYDEGTVMDNTNPKKYPVDYSRDYHVCPATVAKLKKSIGDHQEGRYTWNNRPGTWPDGMNCTGWAVLMLENAGIRPPLPSSTQWLMPWLMR
jgi:YD repeat-containing protein